MRLDHADTGALQARPGVLNLHQNSSCRLLRHAQLTSAQAALMQTKAWKQYGSTGVSRSARSLRALQQRLLPHTPRRDCTVPATRCFSSGRGAHARTRPESLTRRPTRTASSKERTESPPSSSPLLHPSEARVLRIQPVSHVPDPARSHPSPPLDEAQTRSQAPPCAPHRVLKRQQLDHSFLALTTVSNVRLLSLTSPMDAHRVVRHAHPSGQ